MWIVGIKLLNDTFKPGVFDLRVHVGKHGGFIHSVPQQLLVLRMNIDI